MQVRLYEPLGARGQARLSWPLAVPVVRAVLCNLLEDELEELQLLHDGDRAYAALNFGPFKVRFRACPSQRHARRRSHCVLGVSGNQLLRVSVPPGLHSAGAHHAGLLLFARLRLGPGMLLFRCQHRIGHGRRMSCTFHMVHQAGVSYAAAVQVLTVRLCCGLGSGAAAMPSGS